MSLKIYTETEPWQDFTAAYLRVREKEGRVLSDAQLLKLPRFEGSEALQKEWQLREDSAKRLLKILNNQYPKKANVLDIGCGNGWFTNSLAGAGFNATGIDVNLPELEQAARVFKHKNVSFVFADVFEWEPEEAFDAVIISAVLQYFPSPKALFKQLFEVNPSLKKIYILDTSFYKERDKAAAKSRTKNYYAQYGIPEMAKHYHHLSVEELGPTAKTIYTPPHKILRKLIGSSPFPIIEVSSTL
jgi:ubiquinone/menaquinone biosynthesis C-methylase UbiE